MVCVQLQLLLLAFMPIFAYSLPRCLDFRAPFEPSSPLGFCSDYVNYTCCDSHNDNDLKEEFNYIHRTASSRLWRRCEGFVKQILCLRCSPYAAHVYSAESTGKVRGFPGLCTNFCHEFYDKCRSFLWLLDPQLAGSEVLASKSGFCNRVSPSDANFCYPDLMTNPKILSDITSRTSAAPDCLCLQKMNSNQQLAMPLWAGSPGDGSGRLFVMEQLGRIRIYNTRTKKWNFGCFLDLTLKARVFPFPGDERGALGLAFHPDFANNGLFFVFYTAIRWPLEPLPEELRDRPYSFQRLFSLNETGGDWVNSDLSLCGDMCQGDLLGDVSEHILSFGEDEDGEIYMMTSRSSNSFVCDGSLYKIIDPTTRNDPSTCSADLTGSKRIPLPKRSIVWEAAHKAFSVFH